ncbi:MAG: ABC transporter ATP-binding protein [Candidatus Brockarchaeota archaeon]|nr:ABC transporter ATP-binding protein [Candidatus Brockarchaeota archaeon]MBO3768757.1 ABC transporter ATP-binding protein [Candidatus Brockarchaeota archaeon]MBO3800842.1 ABC transporter ATP-binding protein [Candidatus Brockarchaeota archaeon]
MMDEKILEVKNLRVNFYTYRGVVKALNGVNLDLNKGEILGLAGETGSGKSVTGLSILRLLPQNARVVEGEIFFKGRDLLKISEKEYNLIRGKEINAIFQDPHTYLNPVFTIKEQFKDILLSKKDSLKNSSKIDIKKLDEIMVSALKDVKMPAVDRVLRMYPHELSGGMKQRVMLAIAFSLQPSLIIADEPTTALDVTIQAQVLEIMKELQRKYNTSVILITHDLGVIAETCQKVAIMYAGRIVEYGRVSEVFRNPLHPYTKGLMEALPRADIDVKVKSIPGTVPDLVSPPSGCTFHPRCPYAMEICKRQSPRPSYVKERMVECHLYS